MANIPLHDSVEEFAGYRLLKQCGRGAFGEVFLAEDLLGNRFALKRFFGNRTDSKELDALRRYMRIAPHPAICRIYHCGIENGTLFYVMELADNRSDDEDDYFPDTLGARLSEHRRIPFEEALGYCEEIASAIEMIHDAGLTHRDIKPENIIFVNGHPKITDFGLLADLALTQSIAGTLGFMPPELLAGKSVKGSTSDIYALGKILYCSVTGLDAADYPSLPKGLPRETLSRLCQPIAKICAKNPDERCKTCRDCIGLLKDSRTATPGQLQTFWWRLRLKGNLKRTVALISLALILALASITIIGVRHISRWSQARLDTYREAHSLLDDLCGNLEKLPLQVDGDSSATAIASNGEMKLTLEDLLSPEVRQRLLLFSNLSDDTPSSGIRIATSPSRSIQLLESVRSGLSDFALKHLPALPAEDATYQERFDALSKAYGYLDSPLGLFLKDETALETRKEADEISSSLANQFSPRLGKRFTPMSIPDSSGWNFIPPCSFKSPSSGEIRKIEKPFWILDDLVRNELYLMVTRDSRNQGKDAAEPVTNICWNDMLFFCRKLEDRLREHGALPPGYSVRPPTEDEWECVAAGGWSPRENPFGLEGFGAGHNESILGVPERIKPDYRQELRMTRGATEEKINQALTRREAVYKDTQFIKKLSFRPVIAPTDNDFQSKEWFTAPVWHTASIGGKFYGGIATSRACRTLESIRTLCKLLGCTLPEPQKLHDLANIYDALQIIRHYPCLLGATFQDGSWIWNSSGLPCTLENLPTPSEGMNLLGAKADGLYSFAEKTLLPALILEWKSTEAYKKRLDFWKDPWKHLTRIQIGEKIYALCEFRDCGYSAETIAELLGTRLAIFTDQDALKEICKKLADLQGAIAIGAMRHFDGWRWNNGEAYTGEAPKRQDDASSIVSFMQDSLCIFNGSVCACTTCNYLLLEMPE